MKSGSQKNGRVCPVCGTCNPDLAVTCASCGGFLRDRVRSFHLFETLWMLIEVPPRAMQRIIVAERKNYSLLMQTLFGFAYAAFVCRFAGAGRAIENLQTLLAVILAAGPPAGIIMVTAISGVSAAVLKLFRQSASFRNVRAVLSYAALPIALSAIFVFPVQVGLFGIHLFGLHPSPMVTEPGVYSVMMSLDAVLAGWSLILAYIGLRILTGRGMVSILLALSIAALALAPVYGFEYILTFITGTE
jgi:predicted nucleic acid-binding Zn ribbon protein